MEQLDNSELKDEARNARLSFSETRSDSARPEGRPVFPIQHTQPAGS